MPADAPFSPPHPTLWTVSEGARWNLASNSVGLPPKRASKGWRRHVRRAKALGARIGDQRRHTRIDGAVVQAAIRAMLPRLRGASDG